MRPAERKTAQRCQRYECRFNEDGCCKMLNLYPTVKRIPDECPFFKEAIPTVKEKKNV